MDFFLFLLVNATLFIRPAEIIPAFAAWPIYNYIILANLIVAAPAILNYLSETNLSQKPALLCVFGVLAGIFLSHFMRFDLWSARMGAIEFAKVVAYFLLLVATVNTPRRLGIFLATVALLTLAINALAVLHYHGVIEIPSLTVLMMNDYDPDTGERFLIPRMQATGIFSDPNDLSMIIVAGITICACGLLYQRLGLGRVLLVAPIGFLGYSLTLTQSRGGLLALLTACCAWLYYRYGAMRAGLLACVAIPVLLLGFGGRQVDIAGAMSGGTGESRVELWSEGLLFFKSSPLFGIGHTMFSEEAGHVAHNSFVHAFAELGLFGGMAFLGLFGIAGWSLWRLRATRHEIAHAGLRHLLPFAFALLAAYCISMMSLSRTYANTTYMIAGITVAYDRLVRPQTSLVPVVLDGSLISRLAVSSIGFLGLVYAYVQVALRIG